MYKENCQTLMCSYTPAIQPYSDPSPLVYTIKLRREGPSSSYF